MSGVAVLGTRFKQESVIYVGKKAAYFYALMGFMVLVRDGKVTLRARGRRISTAVSAAIILCRLMANGVTIDKIIIGEDRLKKMVISGEHKTWAERMSMVSFIEITLSNNGSEDGRTT